MTDVSNRSRRPVGAPLAGAFAPELRTSPDDAVALDAPDAVETLRRRLCRHAEPSTVDAAISDWLEPGDYLDRRTVGMIAATVQWRTLSDGYPASDGGCRVCGTADGPSPCPRCAAEKGNSTDLPRTWARRMLENRFGVEVTESALSRFRTPPASITPRDWQRMVLECHWLRSGQAKTELVRLRRASAGRGPMVASDGRKVPVHPISHARRGSSSVLHLGHGVWGQRCPDCGWLALDFSASYRPVWESHRSEAHGVQTGPLLPRGTRSTD